MKYSWILSLFILPLCAISQTNVGLVAYYAFDIGTQDGTGNSANTGVELGSPTYVCGVQGQAINFDGAGDGMEILGTGNINDEFDTEDFSLSFYFKPVGTTGTQYLISKRNTTCDDSNIFYIRYAPSTHTINAALIQDPLKGVSLVHTINNTACWQQVTLVRDNRRARLYINGELVGDLGTASRVDLFNNGHLKVGTSDCLGGNEVPFNGLIDELRIYNRALSKNEVEGLYSGPDMILNRDTLLFLGSTLDIRLSQTCATTFTWSPTTDLQTPTSAEPNITPSNPGVVVYTVQMRDNVSACIAKDSISINVVDPATLKCEELYLPRAFTPNDDGLNDTYGISNPFAVQELISFEIFDRWGNKVFYSTDPQAQWDGTFQGQPLNPGVLLYKIRHICNGVERFTSGSLTLLR